MSDQIEINEEGRQFIATEAESDWIEDDSMTSEKFMRLMEGDEESPYAHISQIPPNETIGRHFHLEAQWQIFLEGSCEFEGKHIEPISVQYVDERTPYGPIVAGDDGVTFMVIRPTGKRTEATNFL